MKRLYRSAHERVVAVFCGGVGEFADMDPTVIRLVRAVASLLSLGAGILAYIVAVIIIPVQKDEDLPVASGPAGPEGESG